MPSDQVLYNGLLAIGIGGAVGGALAYKRRTLIVESADPLRFSAECAEKQIARGAIFGGAIYALVAVSWCALKGLARAVGSK